MAKSKQETKPTGLAVIQEQVKKELANPQVLKTLVMTTFKGLNEGVVQQAIVEGMMRGFTFKDFLEKNIYAIPFSSGYSLVTSIDYSRKIGMKSGIVGKSAPTYEVDADGKLVACTITVKRIVGEHIGEFTETAYFDEYNTGRNQWASKPRTMIAKVAEMHALRMACPEELSQSYVEEEMEKEVEPGMTDEELILAQERLEASRTLEELSETWAALPFEAKQKLETKKNELKKQLK